MRVFAMSFRKPFPIALFVTVGIIASPSRAADYSTEQISAGCPAHLTENGKFHMLLDMKVFDGPPAGEAEVVPNVSGKTSVWDITSVRAAGTEPNMLCSFKHTDKTLSLAVPTSVKSCTFVSTYPAQSQCQ